MHLNLKLREIINKFDDLCKKINSDINNKKQEWNGLKPINLS